MRKLKIILILFLATLFMTPGVSIAKKKYRPNLYTSLEKDVPPSKFDNESFYKKSYDELQNYLNLKGEKLYNGGWVCLGQAPGLAGTIVSSGLAREFLTKGDTAEIEVKDAVNGCSRGYKYVVLKSGDATGSYKITGELEAVEKAVKENRCVVKVTRAYEDMIRRGDTVAFPILPASIKPYRVTEIVTGRVSEIFHGDRTCVTFAKGYSPPNPGAVIYFYEISDPQNSSDVDPYVAGTGVLINSSGNMGTVAITSATRAIKAGTFITTRF